MTEKQEWDGVERRAHPFPPSSPRSAQPWRIVEPDTSMLRQRTTTTPPEDYEEVMRNLRARMGEPEPEKS